MGHLYCSSIRTKNKHLTNTERIKIEVMVRNNKSTDFIAKFIGCGQRTVQRELKRGKVQQLDGRTWEYYDSYSAYAAQRKYDESKQSKGPTLKIGHDHAMSEFIENEIKDKKSPDVIASLIKRNDAFKVKICTKTIYSYLEKNIFLDVTYEDLVNGHYQKSHKKGVNRPSYRKTMNRSIEERPEEVEERKNQGHWEMDLILGGKGKGKEAALTITERVTKKEIIRKIPDKTQDSITHELDVMERQMGRKAFMKKFKSFTVDNGSEFLNSSMLERSCLSKSKQRTIVYYAHPYSAYERGTNENMNRMIRRFIPKGANLSQYSKKEIKRIENWLNNYPRKILNYRTPDEVYEEFA